MASGAQLDDIPEPVVVVDVCRTTQYMAPIAGSAIAIGAPCLLQQIGLLNLLRAWSGLALWATSNGVSGRDGYDNCLQTEFIHSALGCPPLHRSSPKPEAPR